MVLEVACVCIRECLLSTFLYYTSLCQQLWIVANFFHANPTTCLQSFRSLCGVGVCVRILDGFRVLIVCARVVSMR